MPQSIFPFTVRSFDTGHFISKPSCKKSMMMAKPDTVHWYAFDVEVISRSEAIFTIYDMEDFVYGGIGKNIGVYSGKLLPNEADSMIGVEVANVARRMEQQEFDAARSLRCIQIMKELQQFNDLEDL